MDTIAIAITAITGEPIFPITVTITVVTYVAIVPVRGVPYKLVVARMAQIDAVIHV